VGFAITDPFNIITELWIGQVCARGKKMIMSIKEDFGSAGVYDGERTRN
jgi:hypothetical protein